MSLLKKRFVLFRLLCFVLCELNILAGNIVDGAPSSQSHNEFDETDPINWHKEASRILEAKLQNFQNRNIAKNIIMFMGDGMSMTTVAATRVYMGQSEEVRLSFEEFPYSGYVKTYCVDSQVADSACSSAAYLCGVKNNRGTLGVSSAVKRGDCDAQNFDQNKVKSIAGWAQDAGKKTGFVTTSRVTHASPGGLYANIAERKWESDSEVINEGLDPNKCHDIARQLIEGDVGSKFDVIFGGGKSNFHSENATDIQGKRKDQRNLVNEWLSNKKKAGKKPFYVENAKGLLGLNLDEVDSVLGLFEDSHMKYHLESTDSDPTLPEMTAAAIKILDRKNDKGYFLFVEGGRIDMAHHETKARKALDETAELSKAVEIARALVDLDETLIIVTADHSHTMAYSGYNKRGSDILGLSQKNADDGLPYMILSYANGPSNDKNETRLNLSSKNFQDLNYTYPSMVPMKRETHGGEDVPIYAIGPWSHLFTGSFEQNFIPHGAAYGACIGPGLTACDY